jgi:phosphonate transport system substrate-binding protein
MDEPQSSSGCVLRKVVKKAILCALLTGIVFAAVFGAVYLLESRAPLIGLMAREPAAGQRPESARNGRSLRFAVATMVSAEPTFSTYRLLVQRICRDVGRREVFVLRSSYADVRRALERGEIDVALVCTGTYTRALPGDRIKLLVQPEFESGLDYRSVFLVPARSKAKTLADLRGTLMAFTDPESNTGCFVPTVTFARRGWQPESFFRKITFTRSHDRSIEAVARGLVDVAAVDSLIWESAKRQDPSLASRARVIWQSEAFGPPPIVVPKGVDAELEASIRRAFLALDRDEEGRKILSPIGIKRFVMPRPQDYKTAIELYRRFEARERPK